MTEFKSEDKDHDYINLLFDDAKEVEFFKHEHPTLKMEVLSGKRQERLIAMATEHKEVGMKMYMYCTNSVQNIQVAETPEQRIMQALGMLEPKRIGITICKNCLAHAIALSEEHLGILKDIQESLK